MRGLGNFILGFAIGGAIGSIAGLLLTPASGDRLRQQIRGYIDDVRLQVNQAADNRRSQLEQELTVLRTPHTPPGS